MFRIFGRCRQAPTFRNATAQAGWISGSLKSAVRKRGLIEQLFENQQPDIGPCEQFRTPAGSCGEMRIAANRRKLGL